MKIHRPLWAEGTFLSSQQFQQQARWEAFSNDSIAQLCIRHPWGIANVLFDRDALMSGKLKTQAVRLRFADGTLIDSDVSDVLPLACDLHALTNDSAVVLLALPLAHGNVKLVRVAPLMHDIKEPSKEKHNHLERIEFRYEKITWTYKDGNIIHSDSWNERPSA
ncbi:hypothetical protein DZ11F43_24830 [Escherichia coli]|nr:hypothetical protein [Escherichia coli]EFH5500044.1 hypothetical protein [Escherichia coli]EFH5510013.1 hypothetical protein [Escherichia coli]EFM4931922.1 type VI secretion system baseplate subunit TssK [Escherichia coli]EGW8330150.1 type VI secretion system baseplate subunit TssK [Escherichia coli]